MGQCHGIDRQPLPAGELPQHDAQGAHRPAGQPQEQDGGGWLVGGLAQLLDGLHLAKAPAAKPDHQEEQGQEAAPGGNGRLQALSAEGRLAAGGAGV